MQSSTADPIAQGNAGKTQRGQNPDKCCTPSERPDSGGALTMYRLHMGEGTRVENIMTGEWFFSKRHVLEIRTAFRNSATFTSL